MPVNDVLAQLQLLLKKSTPLVEGGHRPPEDFLKFTPGQLVQAKVEAALPNGRFLVLVDDRQLDLNLPRNTQPGDRVDLRFVGNQPRPTFLLANESAAPAARPPVSLSDTARFIGALLDRANALSADKAAPLARSAPVLVSPPADIQQFAAALKAALSQSGLFYEAHQAQWVTGQRDLGALLREPQGQLSAPRAFAAAQRAAEAAGAGNPAASHAAGTKGVEAGSQPPAAAGTGDTAGAHALREATPLAARESAEPVHPSAAPLVQQQLEVLDARQVVWQGQVWPGQTLRWEIEEREARQGEQEGQGEWQTRLSLSLPNLGDVGAQLRLSAQGVRVELTTAEAASRERLETEAEGLKAGFERAGLNLLQLQVKPHG